MRQGGEPEDADAVREVGQRQSPDEAEELGWSPGVTGPKAQPTNNALGRAREIGRKRPSNTTSATHLGRARSEGSAGRNDAAKWELQAGDAAGTVRANESNGAASIIADFDTNADVGIAVFGSLGDRATFPFIEPPQAMTASGGCTITAR